MPQDADGSGLVALIWAAWIYWNVYWWLGQLTAPEEGEEERRFNRPGAPQEIQTPPPPANSGPPTLEALAGEILRRDGAAGIADFLAERLAGYETIVAAFDAGDLDVLRPLLSAEVFDVFSDAILSREQDRERIETLFSQIEPAEIVGGAVGDDHMEVAIRFAGECFKVRRDAAGRRSDDAPVKSYNTDIWTFARTPQDRTWRVIATEAGAA